MEERSDRFKEVEDRFADYEVHDPEGDRIGKVDDLFVDEDDNPEYVGVKMGFLGLKSTLIPWELVTVYEEDRRLSVAADDDRVKDGPAFDDDEEIAPEFEREVYRYYGLEPPATDGGTPGAYGEYYGAETADEDELKVQRTEEEIRAGTREREAGVVQVRKRVRTDRERLEIPIRREEITVDRVPVDSETTEAEIGEDEIRMPVTEEEVVVEKRPVAKEEIRVRKDAIEDAEVVEEEVRREEVEIDDETEPRRGS